MILFPIALQTIRQLLQTYFCNNFTDPVDGTMNFVHSLPLIAISIGLLIEKKPVIGIICNPILKQTYTAKLGQGAFLNGKKINVSGETGKSIQKILPESRIKSE